MPKIISSWGCASYSAERVYNAPPVGWGGPGVGKPPAQTSPPQRLRRLASSSSATQVQYAPPKTIFWIRLRC